MAVVMRLARGGAKHRPFYRVVVADRQSPRDGRFIEVVGAYRPLYGDDDPQRAEFKDERVRYWLSQGVKPSARVARLLGKANLAPTPPIPNNPKKAAPKKKAQEAKAAQDAPAAEATQDAPAAEAAQDAPAAEAAQEAMKQDPPKDETDKDA
ncbi:MAG: 30S ribosomal protein S16 [Pseudomonadota bacterium]